MCDCKSLSSINSTSVLEFKKSCVLFLLEHESKNIKQNRSNIFKRFNLFIHRNDLIKTKKAKMYYILAFIQTKFKHI